MPRVRTAHGEEKFPCQYCPLDCPRNKPRTHVGLWKHWQADHPDLYERYHKRFARTPLGSDHEEDAADSPDLGDVSSGDDMQLDAAQSASPVSDMRSVEGDLPLAAAEDAIPGSAEPAPLAGLEEAAGPAPAAQRVHLPNVSLDAQQPDATVEYDGTLFTVEQLREMIALGQQYMGAAATDERRLEAMTTEQLRKNLTTQVRLQLPREACKGTGHHT